MPEMRPVDSTSVNAIGYDEAKHALYIQFVDGATYVYDDVPPQIYEDLMHAESIGGYVNRTIRTNYSYARLQSRPST